MSSKLFLVLILICNLAQAGNSPAVDVRQGGNPISNTNPLGVRLTDGTNYLSVLPVSLASVPLPSGAAIEAGHLASIDTSTAATNTKVPSGLTVSSTRLLVDGSGVTQPISAASLPLPSNAATSALQTSGNSSLTSMDNKTPALGQALAASSTPVVLTAAQLSTLTPLTSVTANAGTNLNTSALNLETTQSALNAKIPSNLTVSATRLLVDNSGVTQPVSGSVSVSNFPATQPVSAVSLPLPTGAATETTLSTLNGKVTAVNTGAVTVSTALPTGTNSIGQVTANAGTNLNTSLLALDSTVAKDSSLSTLNKTTAAAPYSNRLSDGSAFYDARQVRALLASADSTSAWLKDGAGNSITSLNDGNGGKAIEVALAGTNFVTSTGNSTTAQLASLATFTGTVENTFNQQAISILITSDQPGTLTIKQYSDAGGTQKVQDIVFSTTSLGFSRSVTLNGNFTNITFRNTGFATTTTLRIDTAYGIIPATTSLGNAQVSLDEIGGVSVTPRPDGYLRTQIDPTTLLLDNFETLDTTNTWTIGGTVVPTGATGNLVVAPGTAANASSNAKSIPTFVQGSNSYLQMADIIQLEAGVVTGNQRFWGLGNFTTPTPTVPVTNGAIFEIDSATGNLLTSVYSNSVRTQSTQITRPTDAGFHRYAIYYKSSRVYFEVDNIQVSTFAFPNVQGAALSTVIGSVNGGSTVASSPVLNSTLIGLADTGRNASKMSDGLFPWRTATIKPASTASVATDTGMVVALHPSSPVPAGTNSIGTVQQATLTKATQGATGVTTQDLKDAGRSSRSITVDSFAVAATTETLLTTSLSADNGTATTATSQAVTSGKRFRIQALTASIHTIAGNTTAAMCIIRLRANNAGAAIVTSPIQVIFAVPGTAAANSSTAPVEITFADGVELVAGAGLGITTTCPGFVATTAAPKVNISINGYEY